MQITQIDNRKMSGSEWDEQWPVLVRSQPLRHSFTNKRNLFSFNDPYVHRNVVAIGATITHLQQYTVQNSRMHSQKCNAHAPAQREGNTFARTSLCTLCGMHILMLGILNKNTRLLNSIELPTIKFRWFDLVICCCCHCYRCCCCWIYLWKVDK